MKLLKINSVPKITYFINRGKVVSDSPPLQDYPYNKMIYVVTFEQS